MATPEKPQANPNTIRDSEQAREMQRRSAQARSRNAQARKAKREELDMLASMDMDAVLRYKAATHKEKLAERWVQAGLAGESWALQGLWDRVHGKPTQRVEQATVEARPLAEMPQEELVARLRVLEGGKQGTLEPTGTDSMPNTHE